MDTLEKEFDTQIDTDEMEVELPLLPVRDTVVFPRMLTPLFVGRDRSVLALEAALVEKSQLVVVTQRDADLEDPKPEDLYSIGTEVVIGRMLRMPDGSTNILAQGHQRVKIIEYTQENPYLRVRVRRLSEENEKNLNSQASMRAVLDLFEKCVHLNRNLPDDAYVAAMNIDEPGWLADMVATSLALNYEAKQSLLMLLDVRGRLQALNKILAQEGDVLELEDEIHSRVQDEVDKSQREFYLREQMRQIQNELGEGDIFTKDASELKKKLESANLPAEPKAVALKELDRLSQMPPMAPEVGIIRTYIDWIVELPWSNFTPDNLDVKNAAKILERDHYGLKKAKERILEYIAVRSLKPKKERQPILCFVGPPGVGKTSLGRSIADALG